MTRPTVAHIDLNALRHNFNQVKKYAPHSKVMPVIKADAYGHGALTIASALPQADGFAVAFIDEAVALRESGIKQPIVVLQGVYERSELELAASLGLQIVIHQAAQVELLESCNIAPLVVWMKLETGMHRAGISSDEFVPLLARLKALAQVAEIRFMTHFACADELESSVTSDQFHLFQEMTGNSSAVCSLANSAAIITKPETHRDWVRPGIMLYGASPLQGSTAQHEGLKPVMTLESSIIAIKQLRPGDTVGYGASWTAETEGRIAIVAIGYGDGYPRCLGGKAQVLLNGQRAPLVGRVSMDSLAINLSDQDQVQLGDRVILWGKGLPVEELAAGANTISYELLCNVTQRVPRYYHD